MRDLIGLQIPKDFPCPQYVEVDRALARRRYHPLTERKMMSLHIEVINGAHGSPSTIVECEHQHPGGHLVLARFV
jgi:hypothetical protein